MPHLICAHCTKAKPCRMYLERDHETGQTTAIYLCRRCAVELTYLETGRTT